MPCVSTPEDGRAIRCEDATTTAHGRFRSCRSSSRTRVARPLVCSTRGVVLRPRERPRRARELRVIEVEHLGHELERPSTILGSVRAARVLEELERLLERRQDDDWLGLGFRLGLGLPPATRDRDEGQDEAGGSEKPGENDRGPAGAGSARSGTSPRGMR